MNLFTEETHSIVSDLKVAVAAIATLAILMWASGVPTLLPFVRAAALTNISDTLSDSDISVTSDHAFSFITTAALDQDDTIVINLDPTTSLFTVNNLDSTDVTGESGLDVVAACGGGANELTMATTSTTVTLTVCTGDTVSAGTLAFTFDNLKITNPNAANSYIIRVTTTNDGGPTRDTADTRVAILDDVVVTASVDTRFTFTVTGVAASQTVNADATATADVTTATSIPFGTLAPGVEKVLAQDLTVDTNATNGFTVTIVQDQVLTSATGATIDNFIDGANTASPTAWQAPAGTLGSLDTYGHFGITTEDTSLSDGDSFGNALYVGNIDSPREVFYHTAPADGSTANIGATRVGFKAEIDNLQEAGTDYTMTLTYVATPLF